MLRLRDSTSFPLAERKRKQAGWSHLRIPNPADSGNALPSIQMNHTELGDAMRWDQEARIPGMDRRLSQGLSLLVVTS